VRRLYSTFAIGLPGLGLLLLRLAIGGNAGAYGIGLLSGSLSSTSLPAAILHLTLSALVVVGLWTPVAGTILALTVLGDGYLHPALRECCVIVGIVAAATALVGPGRWSVDAQLFGWRRLNLKELRIHDRRF
jgi:putative oxidoreductase